MKTWNRHEKLQLQAIAIWRHISITSALDNNNHITLTKQMNIWMYTSDLVSSFIILSLKGPFHTACVACSWGLHCETAASRLLVFIHTADTSPAAALLPALSLNIEFAFDDDRQYTISLVSSIIDEWTQKWRPESWPVVTRNQSRDYSHSERRLETERESNGKLLTY